MQKEEEEYQKMLNANYKRMVELFLNEEIFLIEGIDDIKENEQGSDKSPPEEQSSSNVKKRKLKTIEPPAKRMKTDTGFCMP